MSATDVFETALAKLIFNNTGLANMGDVTGLPAAATVGSLYVSLHTADPTETGTQTSSEATYTSYARVAVVRSTAGWTVAGNTNITTAAAINFPACTGGSSTASVLLPRVPVTCSSRERYRPPWPSLTASHRRSQSVS